MDNCFGLVSVILKNLDSTNGQMADLLPIQTGTKDNQVGLLICIFVCPSLCLSVFILFFRPSTHPFFSLVCPFLYVESILDHHLKLPVGLQMDRWNWHYSQIHWNKEQQCIFFICVFVRLSTTVFCPVSRFVLSHMGAYCQE